MDFEYMGINWNHFNNIWYHIHFSKQPAIWPDYMYLEDYGWILFENFIDHINLQRENAFLPQVIWLPIKYSLSAWTWQ